MACVIPSIRLKMYAMVLDAWCAVYVFVMQTNRLLKQNKNKNLFLFSVKLELLIINSPQISKLILLLSFRPLAMNLNSNESNPEQIE